MQVARFALVVSELLARVVRHECELKRIIETFRGRQRLLVRVTLRPQQIERAEQLGSLSGPARREQRRAPVKLGLLNPKIVVPVDQARPAGGQAELGGGIVVLMHQELDLAEAKRGQ